LSISGLNESYISGSFYGTEHDQDITSTNTGLAITPDDKSYKPTFDITKDIINIKAELADEESKEDQELRGSFSERPG
jgi:hypothetical protein